MKGYIIIILVVTTVFVSCASSDAMLYDVDDIISVAVSSPAPGGGEKDGEHDYYVNKIRTYEKLIRILQKKLVSEKEKYDQEKENFSRITEKLNRQIAELSEKSGKYSALSEFINGLVIKILLFISGIIIIIFILKRFLFR